MLVTIAEAGHAAVAASSHSPSRQSADDGLGGLIVHSNSAVLASSGKHGAIRAVVYTEEGVLRVVDGVQALAGGDMPVLCASVSICTQLGGGKQLYVGGQGCS